MAGELNTEPRARIEAAHVTQIFQTTVYGGSATLLGSAPNSAINLKIIDNDFQSLQEALRREGLSAEDIQELHAALAQDGRPTAKEKLGPTVSSWIGRMVKKAAEGTWNAGVAVAGKALTEAITKYYGLP